MTTRPSQAGAYMTDEVGEAGDLLDLIATLGAHEPWRAQAACRGMDTSLFFAGRGEDTDRAKATCARCPVRDDCLQAALDRNERFGVFGGLAERNRRKMRITRNRELAAQGVRPHGWARCPNGHIHLPVGGCPECEAVAS